MTPTKYLKLCAVINKELLIDQIKQFNLSDIQDSINFIVWMNIDTKEDLDQLEFLDYNELLELLTRLMWDEIYVIELFMSKKEDDTNKKWIDLIISWIWYCALSIVFIAWIISLFI